MEAKETIFSKRLIITRIISFAIIALSAIFIIYWDAFMNFAYAKKHFYHDDGSYSPLFYFTLVTNIGVLASMFWITLAFASVLIKNEAFEKFVSNVYLKNICFTAIIFAGLIFTVTSYASLFKRYTDLTQPWALDINTLGYGMSARTYGQIEILETSVKHVLIPIVYIVLLFLDSKYYAKEKDSVKTLTKRSIIMLLVPLAYLAMVLPLVAWTDMPNAYSFYDFTTNWIVEASTAVNVTVDIILIVLGTLGYVLGTIIVNGIWYWSNTNLSFNKEN